MVKTADPHKVLLRAWAADLDVTRFADKAEFLLAHGVRLFHRKGVNGTGLTELLEAAGMGRSQFYHYFENKEEFVCAVVRHEMDFFLERVAPGARRLQSLRGLDAWWEPYIALGRMPDNLGCPVGVIAMETSGSSERVRLASLEALRRWSVALAEGLQELKRGEPLRTEFSPDRAAGLLASLIQGALLLGRTFRSTEHIETAREQAREMLTEFRA